MVSSWGKMIFCKNPLKYQNIQIHLYSSRTAACVYNINNGSLGNISFLVLLSYIYQYFMIHLCKTMHNVYLLNQARLLLVASTICSLVELGSASSSRSRWWWWWWWKWQWWWWRWGVSGVDGDGGDDDDDGEGNIDDGDDDDGVSELLQVNFIFIVSTFL